MRFRYEDDIRTINGGVTPLLGGGVTAASSTIPVSDRVRYRDRVRVRFGAEFAFTDNFKAGIRLATGSGGNSTNADLGYTATSSNGGAYAGSGLDTIHLDLAYLEYDKAFGNDWLKLVAGKQLFGQNLVQGVTWDSDINPEGGLVKIGDFKFDDFSIAATSGAYNYGYVIDKNYSAANTGVGSAVPSGNDTWQLINQVDFKYKFTKDLNLRISPGFMNYVGSTVTGTATTASGLPVVGNTGNIGSGTTGEGAYDVRDLNVFFVNAEFNHPLWYGFNQKVYGDYGVNFSGGARARAETNTSAAGAGSATDGVKDNGRNQFAVVGLTQTKGKGKGSWSFDEQFIYQEAYSWDPLLTDSDWNGGYLNGVGFGLATTYNFTDFLSTTVRWRHSTDIQSQLMGRQSLVLADTVPGGSAANVTNTTDLVQIDLSWKF